MDQKKSGMQSSTIFFSKKSISIAKEKNTEDSGKLHLSANHKT